MFARLAFVVIAGKILIEHELYLLRKKIKRLIKYITRLLESYVIAFSPTKQSE